MIPLKNFLPIYPSQNDPEIQKDIFKRKEFYQLKLKPTEEIPSKPGKYLNHQKIIKRLMSPFTDINNLLLFHGLGTGKCVDPSTKIHTTQGRYRAKLLWDKFKTYASQPDNCNGVWSTPSCSISTVSYDTKNKKYVFGKILRLYKQYVNQYLVTIETTDGQKITVTPIHKLYCNKTWTCFYKKGDSIKIFGEKDSTISDIYYIKYKGFVYDFEIEEYHNYFANSILCHNTCASIAVAENFKQKKHNKALVLVSGTSLINNFKNEIATKCTSGDYIPKFAPTKNIKELRTRKLISQNYNVDTIALFVKSLPDIKSPTFEDVVRTKYSNMVIILDEAQNIRLRDGNIELSNIYRTIHKFLHSVENSTILLLSATPMWDKTSEIATLMNLILPMNKQLPIEKNFRKQYIGSDNKILSSKANNFIDIVKGRVSYLRPTQTEATIINEGTNKPWLKHLVVYINYFSEFQKKHYLIAEKRVKTENIKFGGKTIQREIVGGTFYEYARQASNFVFPDGTYGKEGYDKYVTKDYRIKNEFASDIKENLKMYSTKFYSIVKDILEHPEDLFFIYTDFVKGGGANLLAAVLQLYGFTRAQGNRKMGQGKRFALITSSSVTEKQFENIKAVFNDKKNEKGKYIQVFIGSRKIGLGITLKRVKRVEILSPHWNFPTIEQAIGRALRLDSHKGMPPDTKVRIFKHVAVIKDSDIETSDIKLYKIAENKDISDKSVYRLLKKASIDCPLTYERNVLKKDKDYSQQCDYDICNYDCSDVKHTGVVDGVFTYEEKKLIDNSYDIYYSKKEIKVIENKIKIIFREIFYIKTEDLLSTLKEHNNFLIIKTLIYIISYRVQIYNKYGFISYLKEQGDILFLDNSPSSDQNFLKAYYVQTPIIIENIDLKEYIQILDIDEDIEYLKNSCPFNLDNITSKTSFTTQVILLEYAYDILKKGAQNKKVQDVVENIVKLFNKEIYVTPKGTIHRMYIEEFKGSSHTVSRGVTKLSGNMRCYIDNEGWRFCTEKEEEEYAKLIEERQKGTDDFDGNKYGIFGTISNTDSKFRLRIKEKGGKRKKTGQECGSGWLNKNKMLEILLRIKYDIEPNKNYLNISREDLIENINDSKYESVKVDLNKLSNEELAKRLTLLNTNVNKMCKILREWLERKNLIKIVN